MRGFTLSDLEGFRRLPETTRADLEAAGVHGTRAVPLESVCHYGETSGTSGGAVNSTWLTAEDLDSNARALMARHPEVFAPGRILLNRFPFMAAPAHLMQRIAQLGGGVAVPAGNINWDVPFPRALDLARRTGVQVVAGMPLEPIVLAQIARSQGIDPARDFAIDTFFLGGAPLPPVLQERIEREWGARVIELYGSTETMLLGTSCAHRSLHLEEDLVYCEFLDPDTGKPVGVDQEARLLVTTLGIQGSPLLRLDTGDRVKLHPPCACGDPRQAITVLGRAADTVEMAGRRLHSYELIEAGAAVADALDSAVFFAVVLPDRVLLRVESECPASGAAEAAAAAFGEVPVEVECTAPNTLLDAEHLARSPRVYKPVVASDWRRPGRRIVSVTEGMMEWPSLGFGEARRWGARVLRAAWRRRGLAREVKRGSSS